MTHHLAWLTDTHFNLLSSQDVRRVGERDLALYPSMTAALITGDVAEYATLVSSLAAYKEGIGGRDVFFVLGNHDPYRSSIALAKERAANIPGYLPVEGVVPLSSSACLVGVDGWYDIRHGRPSEDFLLNDLVRVEELAIAPLHLGLPLPWRDWRRILARLAQVEAEAGRALLQQAVDAKYRQIIFATHVPPFAGAAWHEGEISKGMAAPWFCSVTMGEMLLEVAGQSPDVEFQVLCGHTHSPGTYHAAPNLVVQTGGAVYGAPAVHALLSFEGVDLALPQA